MRQQKECRQRSRTGGKQAGERGISVDAEEAHDESLHPMLQMGSGWGWTCYQGMLPGTQEVPTRTPIEQQGGRM